MSQCDAMNLDMQFARPSNTKTNEEKMTPPRPPRPAPEPPADPHPRRRLVDFSLPLTWIIGMFFSLSSGLLYIGWMAANQNNLLHQVVESQAESKARQSELSTRVDLLRDQYMELKQNQAIQAIRIGTVERDAKK
jgi:hypothetical protein